MDILWNGRQLPTDRDLTPRQREILYQMAVEEREIEEIADTMCVIRQGIYNHLQQARERAGVKSNHALVAWWWKKNYKAFIASVFIIILIPYEYFQFNEIERSYKTRKVAGDHGRSTRARKESDLYLLDLIDDDDEDYYGHLYA